MTYDLLIKNGTIVDGTGAPRQIGDVAVSGGRIVGVGQVSGDARRVIDASGLIVVPGFVDPHTHYDAQICWDPLLSPSSWHGVTTAVMGNCGVGVAPCRPDAREMTTWDLVNVEGIPFEVLQEGISWDWVTFPEYMDAAEARGSAVNLAFLAPLTPFRHFVMGEESTERAATAAETAKIKALLKEAVAAGAVGISSSMVPNHIGYKGRPFASRLASRDEIKAYANGLRELGQGVIQFVLTKSSGKLDNDEYDLIDLLLTESGRPVTWGALLKRFDFPQSYREAMDKAAPLIDRGGVPQVANFRVETELNLQTPFDFGTHPAWVPAFNQTVEAQIALYRDAGFREAFRAELKSPPPGANFIGLWDLVFVKYVAAEALKPLVGRSVAEIALERGLDNLDVFLDLAIEDNLNLIYKWPMFDIADDLITDPRTLLSLSDGGAHVTMICDAGYCTELIGSAVRERGLISLEFAIKRLTSQPADLFGLGDRGRLQVGAAADIVIFDYETIGSSTLKTATRHDLPGGATRIVTEPTGISYTVVNGQVVYDHGKASGQMPGRVLRSRPDASRPQLGLADLAQV